MKRLFVFLPLLMLAACVPALDFGGKPETAQADTRPRGFVERPLQAGGHALTAFEKLRAQRQVAAVYVGGRETAKQGWKSWVSLGGGAAENVGMQLAALDVSPNVIYLTRPCEDGGCAGSPFSAGAVDALGGALDQLRRLHGFYGFNLIGHGDGATVAALLAAGGREDILSLRTVAGNLDAPALLEAAPRLARLPQKHFAGEDDSVTPPAAAEKFIAATVRPDCVGLTVVPGVSHTQGWVEAWPGLLEQPLEGSCP